MMTATSPAAHTVSTPPGEALEDTYRDLRREIAAVLAGEANMTARMATIACLLHSRMGARFLWTGFYVVDPDRQSELVVGPYQGELGCLRIPFGKGVCGTAAKTGTTQIVDDVHALDNHITCDPRSQSEIVVPVWDPDGALIAVLDIDSGTKAAFATADKDGLEAILADVFSRGSV
jgi:GAF domain-containing protein